MLSKIVNGVFAFGIGSLLYGVSNITYGVATCHDTPGTLEVIQESRLDKPACIETNFSEEANYSSNQLHIVEIVNPLMEECQSNVYNGAIGLFVSSCTTASLTPYLLLILYRERKKQQSK